MDRVREIIEEFKQSTTQVQKTHETVRARLELIRKNSIRESSFHSEDTVDTMQRLETILWR